MTVWAHIQCCNFFTANHSLFGKTCSLCMRSSCDMTHCTLRGSTVTIGIPSAQHVRARSCMHWSLVEGFAAAPDRRLLARSARKNCHTSSHPICKDGGILPKIHTALISHHISRHSSSTVSMLTWSVEHNNTSICSILVLFNLRLVGVAFYTLDSNKQPKEVTYVNVNMHIYIYI